MIVPPLKIMKLRTKGLADAYGASFGNVRNWSVSEHHYKRFHQGWDLEAPAGTPCYAISDGIITHVGHHAQFGKNILLQFSLAGQGLMSSISDLFAFYAHLSHTSVTVNKTVKANEPIGLTGHTGNASASAPHLHFEIRNTADPSPGLGHAGRVDPATVLGYSYLVSSQ
jgi:murein DD-endopeptidase MepM/ murein hydrolase activator NlpD